MTVAASQRDLDAVHRGLTRWMRAWRPEAGEVRLAPLRKPSSGYSSETLFVDVVWTEAHHGHEDGSRHPAPYGVDVAGRTVDVGPLVTRIGHAWI